MSTKKILLSASLIAIILASTSVYYYSDKPTSERRLFTMMAKQDIDIGTLDYYLSHHQHDVDTYYDKALQMAAAKEIKYLQETIHYYTQGSIILDVEIADKILEQLPAESVEINHAAGRIYATNEFGHYDQPKAIKHLEYAALRGDKNAAETLSLIYTKSNCLIEAITWARVANSRGLVSECSELPVDVNMLSSEEWDAVVHNESILEQARITNTIAKLKYSSDCPLNISN